jgi:hypothetical protein
MKTKRGVLGYEDGIPVVAVTAKQHWDWTELRLIACPYCGQPHVHGGEEGHRVAHCDGKGGYHLRIVKKVEG